MQLDLFEQPHVTLLQRIDAAIARLLLCEQTEICQQSVANLRIKRGWVESGQYSVRSVSEEIIGLMAREIGHLTKATGLRSRFVG